MLLSVQIKSNSAFQKPATIEEMNAIFAGTADSFNKFYTQKRLSMLQSYLTDHNIPFNAK